MNTLRLAKSVVVGSHPEIPEILRSMGRGEMATKQGFQRLEEIVGRYLWDGATQGHGELVGDLAYSVLEKGGTGKLSDYGAAIWDALINSPGSTLAAARGVLELAIGYGVVFEKSELSEGGTTLYHYTAPLLSPGSGPYCFSCIRDLRHAP